MEIVNTVMEFIAYVVETYGVVIWMIVAFIIVSFGKEMKDAYVQGEIDTQFEMTVYRLVLAAEEVIVNSDEKYKFVADSIRKMYPGITDEEIKVWIDSTVRIMKAGGMQSDEEGAVPDDNDEGVQAP